MAIVPPNYSIIQNDIIKWADNYDGPLFHALICDPPYHLVSINKRFSKPDSKPPQHGKDGSFRRLSKGFMSTSWDGTDESGKGIAFAPETWATLTQHLYPGAFIMAYAGTRGYHRMACAMEDSGLIIHPAIGYLFGSGWPKATRVDTQIDKAAGVDRQIVGNYGRSFRPHSDQGNEGWQRPSHDLDGDITAPATPLAQTWQSHRYGLQALKPAFEFIAVAQVPYPDRPIDSIVSTGAGALNIDAARIPTNGETWEGNLENAHNNYSAEVYGKFNLQYAKPSNPLGRWPSNFLLVHNPGCNGECEPDCPVRLLDEQSGWTKSGAHKGELDTPKKNTVYGRFNKANINTFEANEGFASRFFYQADWSHEILEQIEGAAPVFYTSKPSTTEREAGLDCASTRIRNDHPCVKPISLNKYLASLLLPPDAYAPRRILNPFMGSGSEAIGAVLAGWESVTGIEQSAHYVEIAQARLAWWSQWPGWGQTDVEKILAAKEAEESQLRMF